MTFMLDTHIVSFALRTRPQAVLERLRAVRPDQTCISAVTLAELRYGAARSTASARYGPLIDTFVSRVVVVPFDPSAAASYGQVRARLEAAGTPIGDLDTLIAGHALATGSVLVTINTAEFRRAGLVVEDWTT